MLIVSDLTVGYGKKTVLFSVSLRVEFGEILTVIGPNGCGKSTLIKTVGGLMRPWDGSVKLDGVDTRHLATWELARSGVGLLPQGRSVFKDLTVRENIESGCYWMSRQRCSDRVERALEQFPDLHGKSASLAKHLSGGEQQQIALARVLAAEPRTVLLDEPFVGLAPAVLDRARAAIIAMRQAGAAVIMVEQRVQVALAMSDRVCALKLGRVVYDGESTTMRDDQTWLRRLFL